MPWRITVLTTGLTCAGLVLFVVFDSMPMRMVVFTLDQSVLLALTFRLFAEAEGRPRHCPARGQPAACPAAIIAIYGVRVGGTRLGHDFSFTRPCGAGAGPDVSVDVFNFGFLLMAMDREVADLALLAIPPASATAGIWCNA